MNKYYNISYTRLMLLLTPIVLRRGIFSALMSSVARPLEAIHNRFTAYAQAQNKRSNAQVCYMQELLNDEFDFYERRIRVQTTSKEEKGLIWRESEDKPLKLMSGYVEFHLLNRDGRLGMYAADFDVIIPSVIDLTPAEIKRLSGLVNKYKLVSKKYRIINGQN
jgi:hypothetical protein